MRYEQPAFDRVHIRATRRPSRRRHSLLFTLSLGLAFTSLMYSPVGLMQHGIDQTATISQQTGMVAGIAGAPARRIEYRLSDAARQISVSQLIFGDPVAPFAAPAPSTAPLHVASLEPAAKPEAPSEHQQVALATAPQEAGIVPEAAAVPPPDAIPLPPANPFRHGGRTTIARTSPKPATPATAAIQPQEPGFFERLFGSHTQSPSRMMAYAPANIDPVNPLRHPQRIEPQIAGNRTAVYVIEHKTVYMPDGTKLEAHSGLRSKKDDPRFVHVRMHGATPPNVYNLVMRERLFHGVEAIRMLPTNRGKMFGRDGILAHTYMLGPGGDSNGCVSFREYGKFLAAFKRGEVNRMIVVANTSSMMAMNVRR